VGENILSSKTQIFGRARVAQWVR